MEIIALSNEYKQEVETIAANSWDGLNIAVHRELYNLRDLPCIIALSDNRVIGYCYYRILNGECEIMAIESMQKNSGVGSALIKRVNELASAEKCTRVYLQTTNDNTNALRFYQRRGFNMCEIRFNELEYARKLKPVIPLVGEDDIPLLHEIELEMVL